MGQSIEYEQIMTEIVLVNLPAPEEPVPGMTGGELLHGFLADLYRTSNTEVKGTLPIRPAASGACAIGQ